MRIKWLSPTPDIKTKKGRQRPVSSKPAHVITSLGKRLIIHEFESEAEALKTMPWIKRWTRETFDQRWIRYHHKRAEQYWDWLWKQNHGKPSMLAHEPIHGTRIIHSQAGKQIIYY